MRAHLPAGVTLKVAEDLALVAVQGPEAVAAVASLAPELAGLKFMTSLDLAIDGIWAHVSRTGYTGEDGVEISVKSADAIALTQKLLADARVKPIGLGARDSLRLEAGLCLYGHDIDTTTTPVEAALEWSIQKSRRHAGARAGGFPGADKILAQLEKGAPRRRVGLRPEGRAPVREGAPLFADTASSERIGAVTSGGFGPSPMRRSRWAICPPRTRPSAPWCSPNCADSDCRCGSPSRLSFPILTNAEPANAELAMQGSVMTTLFTADHEWLRIEGDVATIGVTDYAQSQLGDVVFIELPKVGRSLKKAEAAAVVESVKAASDVYAPISGEVLEVNDTLAAEPALVNSDATGKAWFFKMKIADKSELGGLMDEAAYAKHTA
jgi:glycine cleavage system H protein